MAHRLRRGSTGAALWGCCFAWVGVQVVSGKPPACVGVRQLCRKGTHSGGLTRRIRRERWGCRPEGGSTFFRFERKDFPLRGGSPTVRAVVGASCTRSGFPSGKVGVHRHRQVLPAHSLCRFGPYRKKFIFRNLNFLQNNYSPHHRALRRSST